MSEKQHVTTVKQVILVRMDVQMNRGKIAAQVAHASMKAILNEMQVGDEFHYYGGDVDFDEWLYGKFTKVVLRVETEQEMLDIYNRAKEAGLITALILDSGLTTFNYVPTHTTVAIGPAKSEEIDIFTGHLKSLN